jgi:hypothetical protein
VSGSVAIGSISRLEQPASEPCLHSVQRIARSGLLNLGQEDFIIGHHEVSQAGAGMDGTAKLTAGNARSDHWSLDHRPREAEPGSEPGHRADRSLVSDSGGLDRLAIVHDGQEGNHSFVWEIHLFDRRCGFL